METKFLAEDFPLLLIARTDIIEWNDTSSDVLLTQFSVGRGIGVTLLVTWEHNYT